MEQRTFDRHDIDNMKANECRAEPMSDVKGVSLRVPRVLGGIDADKDFFDHRPDPDPDYRDTTGRGIASRGWMR